MLRRKDAYAQGWIAGVTTTQRPPAQRTADRAILRTKVVGEQPYKPEYPHVDEIDHYGTVF